MDLTPHDGPMCPHCTKRRRIRINAYISVTCTASECQEAEFHANRERNKRRRKN